MKTNPAPLLLSIARTATGRKGIGARRSARDNVVKLASLILALCSFGAVGALASDPVGIYALVDKVVFEPNETNPERIQIWGAFAIAEGNGYNYRNAESGYLYFKLNPEKSGACRNEWSDFKTTAGTRQIVAFASRYGEKGTLRKKDAKPGNPDVYPVAMGLIRVKEEKEYEPFKQLVKLRDARTRGADAPGKKP